MDVEATGKRLKVKIKDKDNDRGEVKKDRTIVKRSDILSLQLVETKQLTLKLGG